jgi:hypothetical protein
MKIEIEHVSKKIKDALVHNDDDRTEIFRLLGEHSDIKMVL